jgi:FkbM family methyltransferase
MVIKSIAQSILRIILWRKKIGLFAAIKLNLITINKKKENKKISIKLFGETIDLLLRSSTTDMSVFNQIFIQRDYDIKFPFIPSNILDAGANIGLSSIFFSKKFPSSKVFSFEPDKENFEMLQINTKNEKNIFCFNNAIWNEKGFLKITNNIYNKDAITVSNIPDDTLCEVYAYSVDDIIEINNISEFEIVKMDIEGSEAFVFSTNTNWLKHVRVLIIEVHDWINPDSSKNVFTALLGWGFYLLIRGENLVCYKQYNDYIGSIRTK